MKKSTKKRIVFVNLARTEVDESDAKKKKNPLLIFVTADSEIFSHMEKKIGDAIGIMSIRILMVLQNA
jgi:hypothetical protein